ncbi:MAG: hypothetical protein L0Y66_22425 [Myxococcaceae bacterium]|nr:hypothetical protein [Myxococcaceae bacterium]MCI0672167.1 hypothetical protein [Myxococcaceae bacterium]
MSARVRPAIRLVTGFLVLGALALPAASLGVMSEPVDALPADGPDVAPVTPGTICAETQAAFARVKARVHDTLLAEQQHHLSRAASEGVHIDDVHYQKGLQALARFELLSDGAWREKMQGVWAKCARSDACTAPLLIRGRVVRTLTYVRATAVPGGPGRLVTDAQLAELLEHEVAHVLLMLVGYGGNQDAFITERWTLGAPDSALASHKRACTGAVC